MLYLFLLCDATEKNSLKNFDDIFEKYNFGATIINKKNMIYLLLTFLTL